MDENRLSMQAELDDQLTSAFTHTFHPAYAVVYHMLLSTTSLTTMCVMQVHSGSLPLSPGSTLAWLGFSEESLLASYDSEVTLIHSKSFCAEGMPH